MQIFSIEGLLLTIVATQVCSQPSPLFYGWFFNETIAISLKEITTDYLRKLYENVNQVQVFLKNVSSVAGIENPLEYYTKPLDPNTGDYDKFFHITAFYCGTDDCNNYTRQVAKYLDQIFSTHLVGVFFTPRTYGIRVNLTSLQREIFNISNIYDNRSKMFNRNEKPCDPQTWNGIEFCPQDDTNYRPTDTRAHITLGCAPNVPAVTTGLDLIEILNCESDTSRFCAKIQTEQGTLIQMGAQCDFFVVYLHTKMVANSTFEAYYSNSVTSMTCRLQFLTLLSLAFVISKSIF